MKKVALIGHGSVGRGVGHVLKNDERFRLVAAADSKSGAVSHGGLNIEKLLTYKKAGKPLSGEGWTAEKIAREVDYDVLVEVTPTNVETREPATTTIKTALSRGKHVVTSNKGPFSLFYPKLSKLAKENTVGFEFEGTVASAVPILNCIRHGLAGKKITALYGILNGTCHYILTRMEDERLTYAQALSEARDLGYAEADPTYGMNGTDAAIKLVILANTMFGMNCRLSDVKRVGIDSLTPDALMMAAATDKSIRLIATLEPEKNFLEVALGLLPARDPLVVGGTLNAVTVETEYAGSITFIGRGAGSIEIASAILADLISIYEKYGE